MPAKSWQQRQAEWLRPGSEIPGHLKRPADTTVGAPAQAPPFAGTSVSSNLGNWIDAPRTSLRTIVLDGVEINLLALEALS